MIGIRFSPATREKFQRFRRLKRAWVSFCLLSAIFVISLFSELLAHGTPWLIRYEGRLLFPRFQNVPRDLFYQDGIRTPPDYHVLEEKEDLFGSETNNWMLWAPIRFSPEDTVRPEQIELPNELRLTRRRVQRVSDLRVNGRGAMRAGRDAQWFLGQGADVFPPALEQAIEQRLANEASPALTVPHPDDRFVWSLSAYEPRSRAPRSVRILLREMLPPSDASVSYNLMAGGEERPDWWADLPEPVLQVAETRLEEALTVPVQPIETTDADGRRWEIRIRMETVQFPFRPVKNHPLGLDESGRDVRVLILYATRISLLFGFTLVACSMVLGTVLGGIQGYLGGKVDLFAQRVIEIYASIPFLYAMIYLGSVFGRSFGLLLFVYAIFNWIGISYYMRAEFLKLRRQPFTEAALSLGLPSSRVMWKHILPNALVPLITFFPFSLVGAIGSLSALDYLGFGLPVGTPSWGDLLSQAQNYRYAWWLILYPALTLFVVILLGVFIGEGLRSAFDPKREVHWEA